MSENLDFQAAEARRAYNGYLRLCVKRPNLATYKNARRNLHVVRSTKLSDSFDTESSRYVWFVAYMLNVFDDLLNYDAERDWKNSIEFELKFHKPTLRAIWAQHWAAIYTEKLGEIVDRAIGVAD